MFKVTYTKDGRQVTVEGITSIDKIEEDTCEQANETAKVDGTAVKTERINPATVEFADVPTEGKALKILRSEIKMGLFGEKRVNSSEEELRKWIFELNNLKKTNAEEYEEIILYYPKKDWNFMTEKRMVTYSEEVGKRWANPIECRFEWAKRISDRDGSDEVWAEVAQEADTMDWYRKYYDSKSDSVWYVGGSVRDDNDLPPSDVFIYNFDPDCNNSNGFPVVRL